MDAREIIFDELYLDPQAKGYGREFHINQVQAFQESGFKGVRTREDVISHVTLQWSIEHKIDWERLAFKDRWLKNMRALFRDLGIRVTSELPTTDQLRGALLQAKRID